MDPLAAASQGPRRPGALAEGSPETVAGEGTSVDGQPDPPTPQRLAFVSALWEKYRDQVLHRVDVVEDAVMAILESRLTDSLRQQAYGEAHKLAGSVGTFGFQHGSGWAREIEGVLEGSTPITPAQGPRLAELVVSIRSELERPAGTREADAKDGPPTATPAVPSPGGLAVLTHDVAWLERLVVEAAVDGLGVMHVDAEAGAHRFAVADGSVFVVDQPAGQSSPALVASVRRLVAGHVPSNLIVLVEGTDLETRLDLIRLGARLILRKPCTPGALLESLHLFHSPEDQRKATILVLDDDEAMLGAIQAELAGPATPGRGPLPHLQPVLLSDPRQFWQVLEECDPDLLVLDHDMPHASGLEICRAVRSDPHWLHLPVLFFSARRDAETVREMFAAGGDDYVSKPLVGAELVARIGQRLERARLFRRFARLDPPTGCWNRAHATARLAHVLEAAARQERVASVVLFDVKGLRDINRHRGSARGDTLLREVAAMLRQAFQEPCVVGRWDGDQFVVGMFSVPRAEATRLAKRLADEFHSRSGHHLTVSVVEFPADGSTLDALCHGAEELLASGRAAEPGRPMGQDAGDATMERPQDDASLSGLDRVDVVLVDDDEALAALLAHALTTRGYTNRCVRDGESALELLCPPTRTVTARVVLLDVSLPGRNGLSVLRELASHGIVPATRVVMLTARTEETEVMEALRAGACDHVGKPFSVPVLMHRVRRALQPEA